MIDPNKPRTYGHTPWFESDHQPLARDLIELERIVRYRDPPPPQTHPFQFEPGERPILLSAPHGAAHTRDGRFKIEDEYTTAFARYLAHQIGGHALFATHFAAEDPNWDTQSNYKQMLAQIIARHRIGFVLDLHGMTNRHHIGMAIGSINGRSTLNGEGKHLITALGAYGFRQIDREAAAQLKRPDFDTVELNHPKYTGGRLTHTITRFASETLGIPALQLEICSSLRIVEREAHAPWPTTFYGDMEGIGRVLAALSKFLTRSQCL